MFRTATLFILLTSAGAFGSVVGCATPAPIYRLEPQRPDVVWVSGRAVVAEEASDVRVAMAFEQQHGKKLVLRVEIENRTDEALEVSPRQISFMTCRERANIDSCSYSRRVIDPDRTLARLDDLSSHRAAEAEGDDSVYSGLIFLSAIADVAGMSGRRSTGVRTTALGIQKDTTAAGHDGALRSLAEERELWANRALRRSTLAPGQAVGGLVFLHIDEKARYVWLHVEAGDRVFPFGFVQMARKPRRS